MMAIYFILLMLPLPASSHSATNQIPSRQTNSPTIPAKVIEILRASFRYMAGSKVVAQHIKAGMTEDQICATWIADLKNLTRYDRSISSIDKPKSEEQKNSHEEIRKSSRYTFIARPIHT